MMPKISIVLPTFNGEKYIKDSIESIIGQSFRDWELIIVNDCSSDDTQSIINEYYMMDKRIHYIENQKNMKLPKSLNIGFNEARGEYLTWTSDDNIYSEDALKYMNDFLDNNHDFFMVCAKMSYVSSDLGFEHYSVEYNNIKMCLGNCVGACFLYRKQVVERIGEYDTDLFLAEDYDYWLRVLFEYGNIGYINKSLYIYRNHDSSLTALKNDEIKKSVLAVRKKHFNDLAKYLRNEKDVLCRLYYEMIISAEEDDDDLAIMKQFVPEICIDNEKAIHGQIIVYGAGKMGKGLIRKHRNNIAFFADKNVELVGDTIEGIEVISLDRMRELSSTYQIVVAVGIEKVYDVLSTLNKIGVKKCHVCKSCW